MKLNQSLTAAITAAALVAGAGFAVAQTSTSAPQVTNTPDASSAQGPIQQNQGTTPGAAGSMNSSGTMQAQPSTSMDSSTSAAPSVDTTLEPRADRN
jgi:hypothetical protein